MRDEIRQKLEDLVLHPDDYMMQIRADAERVRLERGWRPHIVHVSGWCVECHEWCGGETSTLNCPGPIEGGGITSERGEAKDAMRQADDRMTRDRLAEGRTDDEGT